jgi:hypothetical protein
MHLNEHEIRAYYDRELGKAEMQRINTHLADCPSCQIRMEAISQRAEWVQSQLEMLSPLREEPSFSVMAARSHLNDILKKEHKIMLNKYFTRRYQTAWVALCLVLILAVAFVFPPVRTMASSFLGLFRVQRIAVVEFNPANMPDETSMQRTAEDFERLISKQVTIEKSGEPQEVANATEASALAGIPVRLPASLADKSSRLTYQPAAYMKLLVDLPSLRAVLEAMGRADIQLPEELNGTTVEVNFPASVTVVYGQCEAPPDPDEQKSEEVNPGCTVLVQMPSPSVTAPPELDIAQIGEAFLQLLGLSREEAGRFSQQVDWSSTLIIPIPRRENISYKEIAVDGVTGTLIQNGNIYRPEYTLIWIKDGMLFALTGTGNGGEAMEIVGSLR